MSLPGKSAASTASGEALRATREVVIKMLDLSINAKNNLMRCVVDDHQDISEDKTVFCTVYDYLYHADWHVMVPDEIKDDELRLVEQVRGSESIVSSIVESCKGAILKEVDLIHQLNCELFFAKVDNAKLSIIPAFYDFHSADEFHHAIVNGDVSHPMELPEQYKPEMEKHVESRTNWAKRKNPKAICKVIAVLRYDGLVKEFVTFHSIAA